jgi:hypothetical protein
MKQLCAFALALATCASASAQIAQLTPDQVMTGNSSAFADGVWVRVPGQVGHVNCFYSSGNVSLFYAKPNGVADPKKVLALLTVAKLANRTVNIEYDSNGIQSDFWGYGISKCEIQRLVLN